MRSLSALVLFLLFSSYAFSGSEKVFEIQQMGIKIPVKMIDYKNERSQREIRFETLDKIPFVLGYGRDITGDGEVDTFFVYGDNALHTYVYRKGKTTLHRSKMVLSLHASQSAKEIYRNIAIKSLSYVLGSFKYGNEVRQAYFRDWMDLEELRVRISDQQDQLTFEEYQILNNIMYEGHRNAYQALKDGFGVGFAARSMVDSVLIISNYQLLKWAGQSVMALRLSFSHATRNRTAAVMAYTLSLKLTLKTYRSQILLALRNLTLKSTLAASGKLLKSLVKSNEFIYTVSQPALQLATEAYVSYNDVKDPNPLKLAKNILQHETIQMNVGITLVDSMLRSAAEAGIHNPAVRYSVLGAVGAVSSFGVGTVLEGEQPGKRVIFDGVWTVAVDNVIGALDFAALHAFDRIATKAKNPKLKLIGWVIVGASTVANSYVYNRSVDYLGNEDVKIKLIPVEAE